MSSREYKRTSDWKERKKKKEKKEKNPAGFAPRARGSRRRRRRQLGRDLLTEKVGDADQFVDLRGALHRGLGLDGERYDEVDGGVLRLPRPAGVRGVLTQQRRHVAAHGLRHHLGKLRRQSLDELARASSAGVGVGALDEGPSSRLHIHFLVLFVTV